MSNRIRIIDIAKIAGVSKGTVDRVLHDRGNVSPATKAKVMAAMETLEYRPNVIASALAYNRVWRIAAFIPTYVNDPFWIHPSNGIEQAFSAVRDYGVMVEFFRFRDADIEDFKKKADEILAGEFDAVIVAPIYTNESRHFFEQCEEQGIKYLQINTYLERDSEHFLGYIGQDSFSSGLLAAKLLNMGMKEGEAAMILHLEKEVYNSQHLIEKQRGFEQYFARHQEKNIKIVQASFEDVFDKENLRQYLSTQLTERPEISSIFVSTSKLFHIIPHLEAIGKQQLMLAGFDLIEENLKYLQEEKINFLINQNPVRQGYLGVVSIFNYFIRKEKTTKIRHLPLDIVLCENMQYYLDEERQSHLVI